MKDLEGGDWRQRRLLLKLKMLNPQRDNANNNNNNYYGDSDDDKEQDEEEEEMKKKEEEEEEEEETKKKKNNILCSLELNFEIHTGLHIITPIIIFM
jgi:hypothetical protein